MLSGWLRHPRSSSFYKILQPEETIILRYPGSCTGATELLLMDLSLRFLFRVQEGIPKSILLYIIPLMTRFKEFRP